MGYSKYQICQISINLSIFNLGTTLGLTSSKYFLEIIFDIKMEIGILEILDVLDFDKF